jgi:gamma-glutamylcyclotransferase (GGCT)/AIG2-like uncharacterized protein YtfP
VCAFLLAAFIIHNSLHVHNKVYRLKEKSLLSRIDALETSNLEKEKRIEKIKAFEAQANLRDSFITQRIRLT